jgi:hypothetical protein
VEVTFRDAETRTAARNVLSSQVQDLQLATPPTAPTSNWWLP